MNIAGGILYSLVKYTDSLLDRRKKDYLKSKENSIHCDMNQNNTKSGEHRLSLASVESPFSDNCCDKQRFTSGSTATIENEKVVM